MLENKNNASKYCQILKATLYFIALLIILLLVIAYICPFTTEILAERTIFTIDKLSQKELNDLTNLEKNKKVFTGDFVLERIISFYEMLITYLLGLFAIGGFLGYIYIKKSYKADIKDEVFVMVTSEVFEKLTHQEINKIFSEEKKEGGEVYKICNDIENILLRVEFLESAINNEDIVIKAKGKKIKSSPISKIKKR